MGGNNITADGVKVGIALWNPGPPPACSSGAVRHFKFMATVCTRQRPSLCAQPLHFSAHKAALVGHGVQCWPPLSCCGSWCEATAECRSCNLPAAQCSSAQTPERLSAGPETVRDTGGRCCWRRWGSASRCGCWSWATTLLGPRACSPSPTPSNSSCRHVLCTGCDPYVELQVSSSCESLPEVCWVHKGQHTCRRGQGRTVSWGSAALLVATARLQHLRHRHSPAP